MFQLSVFHFGISMNLFLKYLISINVYNLFKNFYNFFKIIKMFIKILKKLSIQFCNLRIYVFQSGVALDPKYFLSYYYLGGVIYTAMKSYSKAIIFFEIALTTLLPMMSQIMVESYKKFVLVSIIHLGTVPTLPKLSPPLIERVLKPVCSAYLEIIPAYQSGDSSELQRTITKYNDVYNRFVTDFRGMYN